MNIEDAEMNEDARVTAYIFGELSREDTTRFEQELASSSELRTEVDTTREALKALESEFANEPSPAINDSEREAIYGAIQSSEAASPAKPLLTSGGLAFWGSVAACFMLVGFFGVAWKLNMFQGNSTEVALGPKIEKLEPTRAKNFVVVSDGDAVVVEDKVYALPTAQNHSGHVMLGGAVNSDAGVTGQIVVEDSTVQLPTFGDVSTLSEGQSPRVSTYIAAVTNGKASPSQRFGNVALTLKNGPSVSGGVNLYIDSDGIVDSMDSLSLLSGDRHDPIVDNPFFKSTDTPLSTFSVDVDTASYAKIRMYLMQQNAMPRPDAVRIEELLNYFNYDYAAPSKDSEHPFKASMQVAECPWNAKHRLARIGIKGREFEGDRPASNLVFLLDVSGSMDQPNKLPLVIDGMKMLVDRLGENDSVAIVVYAGAAGMVLDSTSGDNKQTIIDALSRLKAGGSTNGGDGIRLAYDLARDHFIPGATNRVILCSDGDFNVGVTGNDELVRLVQENAKSNIFLSVLGFGMGNHNDSMMESISNKGNGNYAFIDTRSEARKVLVQQLGATLITIAKDVKIQVEFNPLEVAAYRLIGYENRVLNAQDFNDDKKDAGEIGAGHTVTALYELVPADDTSAEELPSIDDLRYQKTGKTTKLATSGELLTLKLRYKEPEGTKSTLIEFPVKDEGLKIEAVDSDFRFAAAVASFGMLLRDSPHKGNATFAAVEEIAADAATQDEHGYRAEFLKMVAQAKTLASE